VSEEKNRGGSSHDSQHPTPGETLREELNFGGPTLDIEDYPKAIVEDDAYG
jgi:hypothetical protein